MQLDKITLEEIDTSAVPYRNEISLYFSCPIDEAKKLFLTGNYDDACCATIHISMIRGDIDSIQAEISPTILEKEDDNEWYSDIDYEPLPDSESLDVFKLLLRTMSKNFE